MEWITVIVLIILGLGFIIAEIIFVPGTTLLGLLGVIFAVAGIVIGYTSFGAGTGTVILIITFIIGLSTLVFGFKSGAWSKFELKSSINSKVNEAEKFGLQVGEEGIAISSRSSGERLVSISCIKLSGIWIILHFSWCKIVVR